MKTFKQFKCKNCLKRNGIEPKGQNIKNENIKKVKMMKQQKGKMGRTGRRVVQNEQNIKNEKQNKNCIIKTKTERVF